MKRIITIIRSGGQSGVDRAALDFARKYNLEICGWCPKGGWAEDCPEAPGVLALYPELQETPVAEPWQRTLWNMRDAQAILTIMPTGSVESKGTELGVQKGTELGKPMFTARGVEDAAEIAAWLLSLAEDLYGKGRLFILNVPENFADLYKLPAKVVGTLCKILSTGMSFYLCADPKWSLICYDNETFCLHSFRPILSHAQVVVQGECTGIADTETGKIYKNGYLLPGPRRKDDAASTRTALPEYAFDIAVEPGRSMYLQVCRSME